MLFKAWKERFIKIWLLVASVDSEVERCHIFYVAKTNMH